MPREKFKTKAQLELNLSRDIKGKEKSPTVKLIAKEVQEKGEFANGWGNQ